MDEDEDISFPDLGDLIDNPQPIPPPVNAAPDDLQDIIQSLYDAHMRLFHVDCGTNDGDAPVESSRLTPPESVDDRMGENLNELRNRNGPNRNEIHDDGNNPLPQRRWRLVDDTTAGGSVTASTSSAHRPPYAEPVPSTSGLANRRPSTENVAPTINDSPSTNKSLPERLWRLVDDTTAGGSATASTSSAHRPPYAEPGPSTSGLANRRPSTESVAPTINDSPSTNNPLPQRRWRLVDDTTAGGSATASTSTAHRPPNAEPGPSTSGRANRRPSTENVNPTINDSPSTISRKDRELTRKSSLLYVEIIQGMFLLGKKYQQLELVLKKRNAAKKASMPNWKKYFARLRKERRKRKATLKVAWKRTKFDVATGDDGDDEYDKENEEPDNGQDTPEEGAPEEIEWDQSVFVNEIEIGEKLDSDEWYDLNTSNTYDYLSTQEPPSEDDVPRRHYTRTKKMKSRPFNKLYVPFHGPSSKFDEHVANLMKLHENTVFNVEKMLREIDLFKKMLRSIVMEDSEPSD